MSAKTAKAAELTEGRIIEVASHIRGLVPAIMSNGAMADSTNFWAKRTREIRSTVKRGDVMTEHQADEYYHALFVGQLYLTDEKITPYWPSENVEAMIRRGAKKSRNGEDAKIGVTVDGDYPLIYDGPKDAEGLWKDDRFVFKSRINGKSGTTINCRCRFPVWEFKWMTLLDTAIVDIKGFRIWLEAAGAYVGLSAWTPKFGRFEVISVK